MIFFFFFFFPKKMALILVWIVRSSSLYSIRLQGDMQAALHDMLMMVTDDVYA